MPGKNCIQCGQPKDLYTLCDFCDKLVCKECKTHKGCEDQRLERYIHKNALGIEVSVIDLKDALADGENNKVRICLDHLNTHDEDLKAYLTGDDSAL